MILLMVKDLIHNKILRFEFKYDIELMGRYEFIVDITGNKKVYKTKDFKKACDRVNKIILKESIVGECSGKIMEDRQLFMNIHPNKQLLDIGEGLYYKPKE